ncbi:hypothetical protein MUK42_30788 [Musa troglodytarum]|uniref:Uncharacterized protein n=1 Tax=Musa troglodytarum TaxID=320322 RepID=A0A9E7FIZ5_9LILI|nr:hypothetical protein MUK42_30788 [Musa troglodytarum]
MIYEDKEFSVSRRLERSTRPLPTPPCITVLAEEDPLIPCSKLLVLSGLAVPEAGTAYVVEETGGALVAARATAKWEIIHRKEKNNQNNIVTITPKEKQQREMRW